MPRSVELLEHLRLPDKTLGRLQTIYCLHAHSTIEYRVDLYTPKSGAQFWSYRSGFSPDLLSLARHIVQSKQQKEYVGLPCHVIGTECTVAYLGGIRT